MRTTRYCEYCGGLLVRPEPSAGATPPLPRDAGSDDPDRQARFRALIEHPRTGDLLTRGAPARPGGRGSRGMPILFLLLVAFVIFQTTGNRPGGHEARTPLLMAFGFLLLVTLARRSRRPRGPVRGAAVRVAEDHTRKHVENEIGYMKREFLLEFPDGHTDRVFTSGRFRAPLEVDDMGVAYLADDELVDFVRIPV